MRHFAKVTANVAVGYGPPLELVEGEEIDSSDVARLVRAKLLADVAAPMVDDVTEETEEA
jgi:hypothetical protein